MTIKTANASAIYRTHVTLTEEDLKGAGVQLRFAGCDEEGWYFVNNQFAGESHDWSAKPVIDPKRYLHVGDNVIAIGVFNAYGLGGLNPDVQMDIVGKPTPVQWSRSLFNGLAQIIVQSKREAGEIKLTASANGLGSATFILQTKPCPPRPVVP
jgi:beta-galactosidase